MANTHDKNENVEPAEGWAWCHTDGNPVAFPFHSGVFRQSCSEWENCPGPHDPLLRVTEKADEADEAIPEEVSDIPEEVYDVAFAYIDEWGRFESSRLYERLRSDIERLRASSLDLSEQTDPAQVFGELDVSNMTPDEAFREGERVADAFAKAREEESEDDYLVSVENTMSATDPVDAIKQFMTWMHDAVHSAGYRATNARTGEITFIDGDEITSGW